MKFTEIHEMVDHNILMISINDIIANPFIAFTVKF